MVAGHTEKLRRRVVTETPPPPAPEPVVDFEEDDVEIDPTRAAQSLDGYYDQLDAKNLAEQVQGTINEYYGMIRDKVLGDERRIDILEEEVLGYTLEPFHEEILAGQESINGGGTHMTLAFRGAGKSTVGDIGRVVYEILRDPNIRILIVSNTQLQAEIFLREIKDHFENNDQFRAIFGDWVGPKWDNREILVSQRTKTHLREATVTCVGIGGPTASRHYDLIIGDDLADEENSRTELQRQRAITWYMKSLRPTLNPGGRIMIIGTRWHPGDLYGHLLEVTDGIRVTKIPAIRPDGESSWPSRFSLDFLRAERKMMGLPIFETQYQMNVEAMKGKIFNFDDFHYYEKAPEEGAIFQGVDLAIGKKEGNDFFAHATVMRVPDKTLPHGRFYVLKVFKKRLRFAEQTDTIVSEFLRADPVKCGIESNQYQGAQTETVQEKVGKRRVIPIFTLKDKVTRAMKLAARCANGEVLFHKATQMDVLEEMIKMPDGDHDDLFDAVDLAIQTAITGVKKQREREPGVM